MARGCLLRNHNHPLRGAEWVSAERHRAASLLISSTIRPFNICCGAGTPPRTIQAIQCFLGLTNSVRLALTRTRLGKWGLEITYLVRLIDTDCTRLGSVPASIYKWN
ncbi:hypothetical protein VTK26DRAFT_6543 [Humicola hyalothermophila]